jgi:transcriptional regulator with XRE-family HTH domain
MPVESMAQGLRSALWPRPERGALSSPHRSQPRAYQASGLALIEQIYFQLGHRAAQGHLQRLLGVEKLPFAVSDSGPKSTCIHHSASDEISLQDFSPPPEWNVAYSIQLATFSNKEKDEFLFHSGEQLLIPIEGELQYHFFWTPGGHTPDRLLMSQCASRGSILRINPQIPHHAWALRGQARAWNILRHATDSPAALVMEDRDTASVSTPGSERDSESGLGRQRAPKTSSINRRASADDLRKGGAYAMIVWGISNAIREARQRTGMTTTELASRVGMDPSTLSRIEEAKTNVSIEMLGKVCHALHIGIADRMESGSWMYERDVIPTHPTIEHKPLLNAPIGTHTLHPYSVNLVAKQRLSIEATSGTDPDAVASWIVLEGAVLMELPARFGSKPLIARGGSVFHFRQSGMVEMQTLEKSTLVHIVHSRMCGCRDRDVVSLLEGSA